MQKIICPNCGCETATGAACSGCGNVVANGKVAKERVKPPPPPEVADWVFTPVPPETAEEFRRTFDEKEYLVAVRELERTGGVQIADLIAELGRRLDGNV